MTSELDKLDRARIRELFDLRSATNAYTGGSYAEDPNPVWHRLREQAPVQPGMVHELTGSGPAYFWGVGYEDRPVFSAFSWAACDQAFRDGELFASSPEPAAGRDGSVGVDASMLTMDGAGHRRYRALVQPSFIPAKAKWWMDHWIDETVQALIDGILGDGRADLNVDFCAAIPMLTITGSFGIAIDDALDLRNTLRADNVADGVQEFMRIVSPVVAARRERSEDDLISVLVDAEMTDDDGTTHRLTDPEILSFAYLLLAAGSGTTWKQMGITLAALLTRPELLSAVREDRLLLRPAIEESLRWNPTDPMFPRFVQRDIDFHGQHLPKGAVLHLCLGAANRDPERWERPDEFDPRRPMLPSLAFGGGPHVCIGMHVARAEMVVGIGALLDRLPNLRLDPDAPPPQIIGMYERGATELPVLFG